MMQHYMVTFEDLLEIALGQPVEGDLDSSLRRILRLYRSKLRCTAAAFYHDGSFRFTDATCFEEITYWNERFLKLSQKIEILESQHFQFTNATYHFYLFPIASYGWLILVRKSKFEEDIVLKINQLVDVLSKDIAHVLLIAEQKKLEVELADAKNLAEAAAESKELFLANMSHEIRTPLNVVIGMIRQLTKESLTKNQHFYVNQAERSAKHLLTILNNVLDIAKIDAGDLELSNDAFSPNVLIKNVHTILYGKAKEKKLSFNTFCSPQIKPVLIGDETRLRQILLNLVGNAIKFTPKGRVDLRMEVLHTTEEYQQIRFKVTDTGIGMSEKFVGKVFDKFAQEQHTSSRNFEGTGLGMAISNDLVEMMGGKIEIFSKLHQGTTFSFVLNFPIGKLDLLVPKTLPIKKNCFSGKRVLLVEDNEMNRFIAKKHLDFIGMQTVEAVNGMEAIEHAAKHKFDIILMDIQMPVLDGLKATFHIRNKLQLDTPIIALTANAFKHNIDLYLKNGMNDFITKPYDENDFFNKIQYVLRLDSLLNKGAIDAPMDDAGEEPVEAPVLYDLKSLQEISQGNQDFVQKMITIFINLVQSNMLVIKDAYLSSDWQKVKKTVHKIKPSILQMGIVSLKEVLSAIEEFDEVEGDVMVLGESIHKLCHTLESVVESLENEGAVREGA